MCYCSRELYINIENRTLCTNPCKHNNAKNDNVGDSVDDNEIRSQTSITVQFHKFPVIILVVNSNGLSITNSCRLQ